MAKYWMRSIDFRKIISLLKIIAQSPKQWSANSLNQIAANEGIFSTSDGKAFGPTSCYRYRRAMEGLKLVRKINQKYVLNITTYEAEKLLPATNSLDLNRDQRAVLSDKVISNQECYETFWSDFMPFKKPDSLQDFLDNAEPILMNPVVVSKNKKKAESYITISSDRPNSTTTHNGYAAMQAIHYGMRKWGIGQLGFLDEFYRIGRGYHIFPIELDPTDNPGKIEKTLAHLLQFEGEWATPSIAELTLSAATSLRIPIQTVHSIILGWIDEYKDVVRPIPVSNRMTTAGHPGNMNPMILKGFIRLRTGENISHIKIHKVLPERLALTQSGAKSQ